MKRIVILLFALFALLASTALATQYPLTVRDELGREVMLATQPRRIVSMVPSHTETLCALGACDSLVGVGMFSNYPAHVQSLPKMGGGLQGADIEGIVALRPDLVLVSEYGELADTLARAGLTVYAGTPQTYAETYQTFLLLGRLVNRESAAEALVTKVQDEVAAVEAKVAGLPRPRVYYEVDPTPYSVGPASFIGTLIAKAGGDNIVTADMGDFPRLDPEFIVAANPEIIFAYGPDAAALAERPGWAGIDAVKNGRVIAVSSAESDIISRPGPRLAEAVRYFATVFHPDAF
ncbi:MAG TPA: ABC transporter substrate-binding protein [Trueperaceae bacterium]